MGEAGEGADWTEREEARIEAERTVMVFRRENIVMVVAERGG